MPRDITVTGDAPRTTNAQSVIETNVADVKLNDEGAPSQVNGYRVLGQLGEGTFSKVYLCKDGGDHEFALKILNKSFLKRKREYKRVDGKMVFSNAFQKVQKEVAIMKKLDHGNLVKLHEIIDSPADDKMMLVLELIRGGQVMKWDDKAFRYQCPRTTSGVLDPDDVRGCMRDVIHALEYLHGNLICHRDIKPENILIVNDGLYKLADFGVAHMTDEAEVKKTLRNTEGTYHFLAPECTTGEEYDPFRVDIWALGVTMYAMLFGSLPFGKKASSLTDVMDSIRVDPLELEPDSVDADCGHLLHALMTKDPLKRIKIEQLKHHPWIVCGSQPAFVNGAPMRVKVTKEEIEAAFTPVNNFILMARLKVRMASRLARARTSIDHARSRSPVSTLQDLRLDTAFSGYDSCESPTNSPSVSPNKTDAEASPACATTDGDSPSKPSAKLGLLTKRNSINSDSNRPAADACSPVMPLSTSSPDTSPAKPPALAFLKRKSSLSSIAAEETVETQTEKPPGFPSGEAENTLFTPRGSPVKTVVPFLADLRLPKVEVVSSPSLPSSPAPTPQPSPEGHVVSPRNLRVASSTLASSPVMMKKSPLEKRPSLSRIHQDVVHPSPPATEDQLTPAHTEETDHDGDHEDETALGSVMPLPRTLRSGTRPKTQDEAKRAINSIINRTANADDRERPRSPMKEPSVMLSCRKSSTVDVTEGMIDSRSTGAPLSMLSDHRTRTNVALLAPLTSPVDQPEERRTTKSHSPTLLSKKHLSTRAKRSERSSCFSERSVQSTGRATSYAAEHQASKYPGDGCDDVSDDEPPPSPSVKGPHAGERSRSHRRMKTRELSLGDGVANNGDADSPTSSPATSDLPSMKPQEANTSPTTMLGVFRHTTASNVVPTGVSTEESTTSMAPSPFRKTPSARKFRAPSTAPTADTVDGSIANGSEKNNPDASDVSKTPTMHRMLSQRKTLMEAQDSLRSMLTRRSNSVKALLAVRQASSVRRSSMIPPPKKTPSTSSSTSLVRSPTMKSASCAIQ